MDGIQVWRFTSLALLVSALAACGSDTADAPAATVNGVASQDEASNTAKAGTEGDSAMVVAEPAVAVPVNQSSYLDTGYKLADCYQPDLIVGDTIASHACSWVNQATELQGLLSQRLPLLQTTFFATHNSFNSTTYPGLSSSGDPNQSLTLGDQLALGMQGLELDLHWTTHLASAGMAPVVCHGLGASQGHFGCTPTDRHADEVFAEIRQALDADTQTNRLLMLDLEDALAEFSPPNGATQSLEAHDVVAGSIEKHLGDLVYRPDLTTTECDSLALATLSKQTILDAGKRVIVVGGCGVGEAWPSWVFELDRHQRANDGFDANSCEAGFFSEDDYASRFTRLWEDSTYLGAFTNNSLQAIDEADVAAMNLCGLHQVSIDQLSLGDDRLMANVWSWAPGQPTLSNDASCVAINADGHWVVADCGGSLPFACETTQGWEVIQPTGASGVDWNIGSAKCQSVGLTFGLPRSAKANQMLRQAMEKAGVSAAWLHWQIGAGGKVLVP